MTRDSGIVWGRHRFPKLTREDFLSLEGLVDLAQGTGHVAVLGVRQHEYVDMCEDGMPAVAKLTARGGLLGILPDGTEFAAARFVEAEPLRTVSIPLAAGDVSIAAGVWSTRHRRLYLPLHQTLVAITGPLPMDMPVGMVSE